MKCDNCGEYTNRRTKVERLKLLPYPRLEYEWWCGKCHTPMSLNGHSAFLRRWLKIVDKQD